MLLCFNRFPTEPPRAGLRYSRANEGTTFNPPNRLRMFDLIIVDEASMLDVDVLLALQLCVHELPQQKARDAQVTCPGHVHKDQIPSAHRGAWCARRYAMEVVDWKRALCAGAQALEEVVCATVTTKGARSMQTWNRKIMTNSDRGKTFGFSSERCGLFSSLAKR